MQNLNWNYSFSRLFVGILHVCCNSRNDCKSVEGVERRYAKSEHNYQNVRRIKSLSVNFNIFRYQKRAIISLVFQVNLQLKFESEL